MVLSKSQYIRGLQCHKSLWLYKNRRDLLQSPDVHTESMFATGNTVGDYARQVFPGGVEIEFDADDFDGMISKTRNLIAQDVGTIYEASFKRRGIFAMADILHQTPNGWNVYEVKASTSVKSYHIDDAAIQYYALSDAIKINRVFIMHINNEYVRQGDLDVMALFHAEDITDEVMAMQADIPETLAAMKTMLSGDMPAVEIGVHCDEPFECDFSHVCWDVPAVSVFNLYRMAYREKIRLFKSGVVRYEDISNDYALSEVQRLQVLAYRDKVVRINRPKLREFLDTVENPISFFDFETFQNAVPRFDGQRPYMQMPFQYSLHIVEAQG